MLHRSDNLPTRLVNPLGAGYDGPERLVPNDPRPYTVIAKIPGFKIGTVKYPDQELVAIKCIANDRLRLFNHYFKYFLDKVNNVLTANSATWHVVGKITPCFDYIVISLNNIDPEEAQVFETSKGEMLTLISQYRDMYYTSREYNTIYNADLDPAFKAMFKASFDDWLIFIPSNLSFITMDDETFKAMFNYRDGSVEDLIDETSYSVTFVDPEGLPLEHCTPVDISGNDFDVRIGLPCSFSFSVEDERYGINSVSTLDGEVITPNEDGVYTIPRVTSDVVVTVDLTYGEFSLNFEAINAVLSNVPARVNPNEEYLIPFAVRSSDFVITNIEGTNCSVSANTDTNIITVSNVSGDAFISLRAHEMILLEFPTNDAYTVTPADGYEFYTELYSDFEFYVIPSPSYEITEVTVTELSSSITTVLIPDSNGKYIFRPLEPVAFSISFNYVAPVNPLVEEQNL